MPEVPAIDADTLSPFHWGEQHVQRRAAVRDRAEDVGRRFIRPYMPDQHREFYAELMLFFVGSVDAEGRPWASALFGRPGFVSAPDPHHIVIAPGSRGAADPANLAVGSKVGALGLQLHTRRRNRVNGTVVAATPEGGLLLQVDQSFGNCPKYIQTRDITLDEDRLAAHHAASTDAQLTAPGSPSQQQQQQQQQRGVGALGPRQRALIAGADTFLLATCLPPGREEGDGTAGPAHTAATGCDVSHRGGPSGFVEIDEAGLLLTWPDYVGNNFFNSLGNIAANPASGLLFIDWLTGDTLQVAGEAVVDYEATSLPGAQRTVNFQVREWVHIPAALPIRPAPVIERSPYNPRLLAGAGPAPEPVRLVRVALEAEGIKTYEFEAPPSMRYSPGQFASFDFTVDQGGGTRSVINRTWTISSHPEETAASGRFSITVKRAGLVSSLLFDSATPGDAVAFRGVGGSFTPVTNSTRPALLVAGGIGITPLRVMFKQLLSEGRAATLLYSVRSPQEAAFLQELTELAQTQAGAADAGADAGGGAEDKRKPPSAAVVATVTGSANGAWGGRRGRIDEALVQEVAGGGGLAGWEVYMCGPEAFMAAVEGVLVGCGAEAAHIHTESFSF